MRKRVLSGTVVCIVAICFGLALSAAFAKAEGDKATGKADREAARKARLAERETEKEARQTEREKAKESIEAKKKDIQENRTENREKVVDNRQANQEKRIQHGIKKGYLTADEIKKLEAQQASIATLETSLKADGKITRNEFKQLQTELNEASRCIWAEKHDTDGNQMPTYRLGKNIFARNDLTSKLADENLSAADAKALLKDFHRTVELKRKLSTDNLSADERAKLQAEYDALLNKYFEVR
jgi:hypothetical protein